MFQDVEQIPNFPEFELQILKFWEKTQAFQKLVAKNRGKKRWSFFDGPITANNPMGVHHAWGRTYKDIFIRHHAMLGHDQRYQNGFDCQGLWVEVVVEKDLKLNSKRDIVKFGLDHFSQRCRERVEKFSRIQTEQSIRLGQWMDWDHSYYTMADTNIETIWHFLKKCHDRGWLYQGHRCMPWCTRCGTSLSQHELHDSYKDLTHRSVTMHLPIVERPGEYIMVWTTTPWTLSANTALAVHPELEYIKAEWQGKILYLSKGTSRWLKPDAKVVGSVKGKDLIGLHYRGPMDIPARKNLELRIVGWNAVGEAEGTGVVHIAPGCGAEDFELSKVEKLAIITPIDEAGFYVSDQYGPLYGTNALQAAKIVFEHLKQNGYLYEIESYTHRYPVCWRCQEELVFRLVDEWFIRGDEIREPMKKAAANVQWIPDYAGTHMQNWLDNMGDWCISRRRFWGLPLPFYRCEKCGKWTMVGSKKELESLAVSGMDQLKELHRPWIDNVKIRCQHCGHSGLSRVEEVGDCWLDAGIISFSTLDYLAEDKTYWKNWYPCEFITEMVEQVRLWFYSMLFMSVTLENCPPYKTVLTYSAVVDQNGDLFSKTKGNAIPFDEAASKMGADIMRWMYAGANIRTNLKFGYGPAEDVRRKILTFWNVYKFFVTYARLDKPNLHNLQIPFEQLPDLDRWLISHLNQYLEVVNSSLNTYDAATMIKASEEFWDHLSNWYLRQSRRRFWKSENDTDKLAAYYTLYRTLKTLCLAMAPVLPFTMEYVYQNLVRTVDGNAPESVHHNDYPQANPEEIDRQLLTDMELVMRVCQLGHAARDAAEMKVRQPLARMMLQLPGENSRRSIERFQDLLMSELNIKKFEFVSDAKNLFTYELKPNFRLLGKKHGAKMNAIKEALTKVDAKSCGERIVSGQSIDVVVGNETITLLAEEVQAEQKSYPGLCTMQDRDLIVVLDSNLTDELRAEGYVRDFVRHVQTGRKDANYQVADHIHIYYKTSDATLAKAIQSFASYIQEETLANTLQASENPQGDLVKELELGTNKMMIAIKKA